MSYGPQRTRRWQHKSPDKLAAWLARADERAARKVAEEEERARRHAEFIASLPDEMPPVEGWDNPTVRRKTDDFGDAMRLRRARMHGAATSEPVVRRLIIVRDNSTCWICRRVVPEDEIHLDHVIPISRGGKHHPDNVRVACASCNLWKGARLVQVDQN